jgi:hypothetical protein
VKSFFRGSSFTSIFHGEAELFRDPVFTLYTKESNEYIGLVHPDYNPYFSAGFFSRNSVFLSQQISQQCFPAGLSAQPNGAVALFFSFLFFRSSS